MPDLINVVRANGYRCWICGGGSVEVVARDMVHAVDIFKAEYESYPKGVEELGAALVDATHVDRVWKLAASIFPPAEFEA